MLIIFIQHLHIYYFDKIHNNVILIPSVDLYDPSDDYRIKMFETEYKEEIKEAEDLGKEDVDEIDEKGQLVD